jgi:hypothetical protein
MSDPSRLVEGHDQVEKGLLRSWSTRQPPDAARVATLAAVGLGSVAGAAGAGASLAPKALVASSSLVKWLAVAGGLVATAGAVGYASHELLPRPAPVLALPSGPSDPTVHPRPPAVPAPPAPAETPALPTPPSHAGQPTAVSPRQAGGPVAAPKSAQSASALEEEVRAVDDARRTLHAGDAAGAIALLDAYEARYPAGALAQESAEVRIEALYRSGKRAQADVLAARFVAAHPTSPYARVIRALQAGTPAPPP